MKGLKMILTLLFAVGILSVAVLPVTVQAANKTRDEALQWVRSQVGRSIDADGAYGAQCVDLILAYYDYLGVPRALGNGKDYSHNALPSGWQRLQGAAPQAGDILVYGGNGSNPYGHVAIFESTRVHYHQNFNGHSYVEKVTYTYNGLNNPYWGVIRPAFATGVRTDYQNLGQSFDAIILRSDIWRPICRDGSNVVLSAFEKATADFHWHFERQGDGSYIIQSLYDGRALDVTGAGNTSGTNVGIYDRWGDDNGAQKWYVYSNNIAFELAPKLNLRLRLDVQGAGTAGGTNIQVYTENHSAAQIFSIYKITGKGPTAIRIAGASEMTAGASQQLNVDYTDATGWKTVRWSSSDDTVAAVDASGKVTAKKAGSATITAFATYNDRVTARKEIVVKGALDTGTATVGKVPSLKIQTAAYDRLKLTWGSAENAEGYRIFRATSKNGRYTQIKEIAGGSTTTYTDTKRSTGTAYYYKVRAYATINGETVTGGYSPIQSGRTSLARPNVNVASGRGRAVLKWGKINGAHGYVIYAATSKNGNYKAVKTIWKGSTLTCTQNKLKKGKTYYYKIRAYRISGLKRVMSAYSDTKAVKIK